VTIHPFGDGNGRIARALADMSFARSEQSPHRFYSLASQIRRERSEYYTVLEQTQKGDLDITAGLLWFARCFSSAVDASAESCKAVLFKAEFWQQHALTVLNERQRRVMNRVMDGFEGKLTAAKWAALSKCSLATAQRDVKELIDLGILLRNPGGSKNSSYRIAGAEA
jgi:Fic family protein